MLITGFIPSPNPAVPGERIQLKFSIRLEGNETVHGPILLKCGLLNYNLMIRDSNWVCYRSTTISTSFDLVCKNQALLDQLAENRAVEDPEWILQIGSENKTIRKPITYLNARYAPAIQAFSVERGENGLPEDTGERLLLTAKLSLADGADPSGMRVHLHYAQEAEATVNSPCIDLSGSLDQLLSGVTDDASIVPQTFANNADWNFLLTFGDDYEQVQAGASISEAFANLHLSGAVTGGVCVGGFSSAKEGEPKFECHYPAYFYGGIALGGMKDFSTEETDTGVKWLNGKAIYAKTLVHTAAAGNTAYELALPADVEMAWLDMANSFHVNANGLSFPPYAQINNVDYFICLLSTGSVTYKTNAATGGDFYIRVFYTKL